MYTYKLAVNIKKLETVQWLSITQFSSFPSNKQQLKKWNPPPQQNEITLVPAVSLLNYTVTLSAEKIQ